MSILKHDLTGVILAAGKGTRAYPYTKKIPKAMLDICGKPLLYYTLNNMKQNMNIVHIIIVINKHGTCIKEYFGDGSPMGLKIEYVENDHIEKGPMYSLFLSKDKVKSEFIVVMLSDEIYLNSNHGELIQSDYRKNAATITAKANSRIRDIRKNFSIELGNEGVCKLVEKPTVSHNRLLGCGTYVFHNRIYATIQEAFDKELNNAGDITATINRIISQDERVGHFLLKGEYINTNYGDDINKARSMIRKELIKNAKIDVIMPCEHNNNTMHDLINACKSDPLVHHITLVTTQENKELQKLEGDNNIKLLRVPRCVDKSDYGSIFHHGITHSECDIVILMMNDDSFEVSDIHKLFAYITEADIVLGTRTTRQMIEQGSNVKLIARLGNVFLAKLVEALWANHKVRLTDVGCVFRIFWKDTYTMIQEDLRFRGGAYLTEMVIEVLRRRRKVIELPVNYCRGCDESMIRVRHRNLRMFLSVLKMIFMKRFNYGQTANKNPVS